MKWRLMSLSSSERNLKEELKRLLGDGWEPFAVTCEPNVSMGATTFNHTIWFRKAEDK